MAFSKELNDNYWRNLEVNNKDIEFLFSYLFEAERPLTTETLVLALIKFRISTEKQKEQAMLSQRGTVYLPKEKHEVNQRLVFPALGWIAGKVSSLRDGINPEQGPFKVIGVDLEDGSTQFFASEYENHELNNLLPRISSTNEQDESIILQKYSKSLSKNLQDMLSMSDDLVRIGHEWFPKALLMDFSQGHLNIVEAILDMQGGGPIDTDFLLNQFELDSTANIDLMRFSLNYMLHKDKRFDEVGSKGVFSWFLHRLEPEYVQNTPIYLQNEIEDYQSELSEKDKLFISNIDDELIQNPVIESVSTGKCSITLIYPHWRVGSIPLTPKISQIFPSAFESERIKISLIDKDSNQEVSAWVVRPQKYIYGLEKWYREKELIPGSIINLEKSENSGVIYIQAQKKRSNREWIKTVLVGADAGIVIALLKQPVTAGFSEQMAISIPDPAALDEIWKSRIGKSKSLLNDTLKMMQELSKLNQQRHVHFIEVYSIVNLIRRCPPEPLLYLLNTDKNFSHVGDYYFHLKDIKDE